MAKKRVTKVPEGITMKRTPKGINVTISENGRIIAVLRGYNNVRNAQKGLSALYDALCEGMYMIGGRWRFSFTDLTPKPKKAAKKK